MLRQHADGSLRDLCVLRRGNRLSITPVTSGQWHRILELADHSTG
jgi:predicted RNA-binding protein with PUA-like domain